MAARMNHGAATIAAPAPLQDDDGHLLRMQPSDSVASSGLGVAGRERMGRLGAGASGRVDHQTEVGGQEGFRGADFKHFAADGNSRDVTADDGDHQEKTELFGPAHRHFEGMGWCEEQTEGTFVQEGDVGRLGSFFALGKANHHGVRTYSQYNNQPEKTRI